MLIPQQLATYVAASVVALSVYAPAVSAQQGGGPPITFGSPACAQATTARTRGECEARQQAREQASAGVRDAVAKRPKSRAERRWQQAVDDARQTRPADLVSPRMLALVGGAAWFWLALRSQRRRRRRIAR